MKIFAAIANAGTVKMFYEKTGIKLNYLISYYYLDGQAHKITKEYRKMVDSLFLDSGAYSAEAGNIKISVSEYRTYLKLYGDLFNEYFNLDDSFDDTDHNQWNQSFIEKDLPDEAKNPIPVVHDNKNPFNEFRLYVNQGYKFIALGSTTSISDAVFDRINKDYPEIKVHIFGGLDWDELERHRPYSADSATWGHAAGNGNIMYWDPDENERHTISVGSRDRNDNVPHFKTFEHREKLEEFLHNTFSWDYGNLLRKGGAENRMIVNLYFYNEMEKYLNSN
jgi:hypothetical protein